VTNYEKGVRGGIDRESVQDMIRMGKATHVERTQVQSAQQSHLDRRRAMKDLARARIEAKNYL